MNVMSYEIGTKPIKSDFTLFEEEAAHYISLGEKGYAICWLNKVEFMTEPDQVFIRIFDSKALPRCDEILIATSSKQYDVDCGPGFSVLKFPVMKYFEDNYLIVAWAEDMDDIFMQKLDLNGNLIGDSVKLRAFHNLAYSCDGMKIILDILFSHE